MASLPTSLGQLRSAIAAGTIKHRPVKDEIRENLIARGNEDYADAAARGS